MLDARNVISSLINQAIQNQQVFLGLLYSVRYAEVTSIAKPHKCDLMLHLDIIQSHLQKCIYKGVSANQTSRDRRDFKKREATKVHLLYISQGLEIVCIVLQNKREGGVNEI